MSLWPLRFDCWFVLLVLLAPFLLAFLLSSVPWLFKILAGKERLMLVRRRCPFCRRWFYPHPRLKDSRSGKRPVVSRTVADLRPVQRPIEQCVFPVQHSPLERSHFAVDALACWVSALVVWTG